MTESNVVKKIRRATRKRVSAEAGDPYFAPASPSTRSVKIARPASER